MPQCPLFPRKQTSPNAVVMPALCQKQTHALQQKAERSRNSKGAADALILVGVSMPL